MNIGAEFVLDPTKAMDTVYQQIEYEALTEAEKSVVAKESKDVYFPSTKVKARVRSLQMGE